MWAIINTITSEPQPWNPKAVVPKLGTRNREPETGNRKPGTRNQEPETRNPKPTTRNPTGGDVGNHPQHHLGTITLEPETRSPQTGNREPESENPKATPRKRETEPRNPKPRRLPCGQSSTTSPRATCPSCLSAPSGSPPSAPPPPVIPYPYT